MSIVAIPFPHQPFSEANLFASSGAISAHAEFHPPLQDARPPRIPFPVFQHRHSSPYPMHHSFSVLGPPSTPSPHALASVSPPAPNPPPVTLPVTALDGSDLTMQTPLPPTPDPSPPNSKILFPTAMIKLAPPAAESAYHCQSRAREEKERSMERTPRRLPTIHIDDLPAELTPAHPGPGLSANMRTQSQLQSPTSCGELVSARPKSMGPPIRPIRQSQTAIHPSSFRMVESQSADSRARLRSSAAQVPRHSSRQLSSFGSSSTLGFPRTLPESSANPEIGGPDGLEAKVVLLGSQGVGKTSLILRYTTRLFSPSPAPATIGSSLHTRKLVHSGVRVKLQIWDTAGQERFRSMAPIYYRGAHVCVLVYDIASRASFDDVRSWLEELGKTVPKETVIFVVGSKLDLQARRAVSLDEARLAIRAWLKPPPPPVPEHLLSPSARRNLFRSSTTASRPESIISSPTPARSHSQSALSLLDTGRTTPSLQSSTIKPLEFSRPSGQDPSLPPPRPKIILPVSPPTASVSVRPPTFMVTSPNSAKRISFPVLQSPTTPTFATHTDLAAPTLTPASPSRHGISGGRFSMSGVWGYSRTTSMGGAIDNLTRLAEDFPASRPRESSITSAVRVRHDSAPLLSGSTFNPDRRKSEDWSSRSWKMGEGPGAAETLGEFGDGVKKKGSGELLIMSSSLSSFKKPMGRARGGSLGRDSRLYGDVAVDEGDGQWGVEVEGVRIGECSAMTGEGVEALFKSISSLLVDKKDKIELEHTLRRRNSVMLTDPAKDAHPESQEAKGRYGCCA